VAFKRSRGLVSAGHSWVFDADDLALEPLHLREGLICPTCARSLLPPRPGYFSYESPLGACENCRGFGRVMGIDLDKVIPDERARGMLSCRPAHAARRNACWLLGARWSRPPTCRRNVGICRLVSRSSVRTYPAPPGAPAADGATERVAATPPPVASRP
jgi:hypothetical protein